MTRARVFLGGAGVFCFLTTGAVGPSGRVHRAPSQTHCALLRLDDWTVTIWTLQCSKPELELCVGSSRGISVFCPSNISTEASWPQSATSVDSPRVSK